MSVTPAEFADWLLTDLGDDPTVDSNDVPLVEDWEAEEGGNWNNTAAANPLNTTLPYDGSTVLSGGGAAAAAGVQAYGTPADPNWNDGLAATVATLENTKNVAGQQDYGPILSALADNDPAAAAAAIVNSPWGTGKIDYDGVTYTKGATAPSSTSSGSSSSGTTPATSGTGSAESTGFISGLTGGLSSDVKSFAITAMFAIGAIAIVVLGVKQTVQPTLDKAGTAAKTAGEAAAL
jgi:hypothetical protein